MLISIPTYNQNVYHTNKKNYCNTIIKSYLLLKLFKSGGTLAMINVFTILYSCGSIYELPCNKNYSLYFYV